MFSPISDDNGKFLGLYNSGYEITAPVMLKRRLNLLHKMASPPNLHETTVWKHIMGSVESFERDLPFFAIYSATAGDTSQRLTCHLWLEGFAGIEAGHAALPESFDLYDSGEAFGPACRVAKATGKPVVLGTDDGGRIPDALNGDIEWQGHGQVATRVAIIPIFTTGLIAGFVVAALNPLRPYDEAHEQFVSDIGHVVTTLLSSAVSFEQARAREAQLMKELTERERFTRIMAEVATVGIFNLDLDGTITWANSRYYEITQLSTDSVKSSLWMDCVLKEDHLKVTQCLARCRRAHEPTTCDVRLKETWQPPNGAAEEPQWVLASLRPHMEDGVFQGVMGSLSDVSHVKWSEQLQKSNADAAITAQVQLTSFMDLSSHELRNVRVNFGKAPSPRTC
jgi:PAS domain S-box-containing protein